MLGCEPATPPQVASAADHPKVEVFLTDWCPYCRKLEAFLEENGVAYERRNVEQDADSEREFARLGGGGIPLTRIGGETLVRGAQLDRIAELIGVP